MRFEDDINTMIEWGKEENQLDYVEFVEFLKDCHADKKPVVVEENGTVTEFVLCDIIFLFKKPFHDFDISLQYYVDEVKKSAAMSTLIIHSWTVSKSSETVSFSSPVKTAEKLL